MPREVAEPLCLEALKKHIDVVHRDTAQWATPVAGGWLDRTILEVPCNVRDSVKTTVLLASWKMFHLLHLISQMFSLNYHSLL